MPAICDLGHVGDGAEEFSGKDRFRSEAIETGRIDIDGRNLGAGRRERACHHASHAVRRSGDDGHAARKQLRVSHDGCLPRRP